MTDYLLSKDIATAKGGWFLTVDYWGKKRDMHFSRLEDALNFIKQKEAMFGTNQTVK